MNCPVCHKAGLPAHATVCPQCNSDLSAFALLDQIAVAKQAAEAESHAESQAAQAKGRAARRVIVASGAVLLLLLLALACALYWLHAGARADATTAQAESRRLKEALMEQQAQLDRATAALQAPAPQATAPSPKTVTYIVRQGDTFYRIARSFYGDGRRYPRIMEENGVERKTALYVGDTLIITLPE